MSKYHPFEFPTHIRAYFIKEFPVEELQQCTEVILSNDFIRDIKENGIKAPIIVNVENKKLKITFGNKRYVAAKQLGIKHVDVVIVGNVEENWFRDMIQLENSDDVITVFGGPEKIDINHLCIDDKGRLVCVSNDHKQWVTSEIGKIPEQWIKQKLP